MPRSPLPTARPFGFRSGAAFTVLYALLAAALLWPWPLHLATSGLPIPDFVGNVWVLEQNLHNWTTPGAEVVSSNAFWPHEKTFAYNEALFAQTLEYIPARALGAGPLLAHNLTLFATFPLCGLGAALLAFELFGSRWGAFVAGLAFAFSSYRWDQFPHLQSLSLQWLPLVLWSMVRYERTKEFKTLGALFTFALLLATSSGYSAVLCAVAGGAALTFLLVRPESRRSVLGSAAALIMAAAAVYLIFTPYREAQQAFGMQRGGEVIDWSARFNSFFKPSGYAVWPHLVWLRDQATTQKPLFAGTIPIALALFGMVALRRERAVRLMLAVGAASLLLALGPRVFVFDLSFPGPFALLAELPVIGMLRTPSRIAAGTLLSIAILAAAGLAALPPKQRRVMAPILSALLLLEVWPKRLGPDLSREIPKAPRTSTWLKTAPTGPMLELPWTDQDMPAMYLYWAIEHWQPMVNGWGSFQPPGSLGLGFIGHRWPTPYTSRVFRRVGIRYIVVHAREMTDERKARLRPAELPEGVRLAADFGDDLVWEISPEGAVEESVPGWPPGLYARASSWRSGAGR